MPYRILHIADVHLDMPFSGLDAAFAGRRRAQLQDAFERALALARERQVDSLCIAGDLYEDGHSGLDRAAYLRRSLGELAPMRVFVSPGNHDPATPSSLYRYMDVPDNVTIFAQRQMRPVALTAGLTLWGCGHEYPLDREPILRGFACEGSGTHLLLFHGSDTAHMPPEKECVAPFTDEDIRRTGAAHAMVGHFHSQRRGEYHAYPGSLEPQTRAQIGRHTASLVTVDGSSLDVEFIDVNRTRYATVDFDVTDVGDRATLVRLLRSHVAGVVTVPGEVFCRVRLVGAATASLDLSATGLTDELASEFPGLDIVDDSAVFDLEAIENEGHTVRAEFVRSMRKQRETAAEKERQLIDRAIRIGLLAFAGKQLQA